MLELVSHKKPHERKHEYASVFTMYLKSRNTRFHIYIYSFLLVSNAGSRIAEYSDSQSNSYLHKKQRLMGLQTRYEYKISPIGSYYCPQLVTVLWCMETFGDMVWIEEVSHRGMNWGSLTALASRTFFLTTDILTPLTLALLPWILSAI